MAQKFVVSHLDEQMGPFLEEELKAKWVKGELLPIDYVYDETKQDWLLLSARFAWAANKPEPTTPPPLKDVIVRKARPPEPPKPVEISGTAVVKEWKKDAAQGAKVKLVDGVGEIDLSPMQPGQVEVVLQESSAGLLRLQQPLKIQVKPAEPEMIEWTIPATSTVGQDVIVHIKALDARGHVCSNYDDQFTLKVEGPTSSESKIELAKGEGRTKLQHTKTESWKLSLTYSGPKALKMPEAKTLEWHPGAATKLILDGPQEYISGHPLKVQVKAVDQFGNLAKTFQGTVILEVKAS